MAASFPIAGIGASAGGLESFARLLAGLPLDSGMAFVLVQHLDPLHDSKLTELLARSTKLPVREVRRAVKVEPNQVYVIPPDKYMGIADGTLKLVPRPPSEMPPMPIDFFLRALAEDRRHNAIGVILSGNGLDGALGLEAIKGADGITFAQDLNTAKFTGMPRSAVASGCVDFVLTPEAIACELTKITRHPHIAGAQAEKAEEPESAPGQIYAGILSILRSTSGVDFAQYKQSTLKRRILRRMVVRRIDKLEHYLRLLESNLAEVEALFEDALITVTRFFREADSFEVLLNKVFPSLLRDRSRQTPFRLWVPGCSSGEEAYSVAMSLVEFLGDKISDIPIQIFGTDISESAIARARAGVYRGNIALDVSADRLRRFFTRTDGGYRISKSIRDLCVFARHNLSGDPPFSRLDLISCHNVLIYFDLELQKKVVQLFHYALQPHGYLLLSRAEGVSQLFHLFTPVDKKRRLYTKTRPLAQPELAFAPKFFVEETEPAAPPETVRPIEPGPLTVERVADRVLLQYCAPSGVVIDSNLRVLQFHGNTAPFLEHPPGAANLNLMSLVPNELAVHLRSAIAKAFKENVPVRKQVLLSHVKDQRRDLKLEVVPFAVPHISESFCLVLFEKGKPPGGGDSPAGATGRRGAGQARLRAGESETHRLRAELDSTRESLQAIIEELQSVNEEGQSTNEELQSANEELETSKEELQSANEELRTVNEELGLSNLEANRVNNDLTNLLASVQIPVVMVDNDLAVRRFTPSAQKFFNLIPTDIGRNFNDIRSNLELEDLDRMVREVLETQRLKEREVRDRHGHWYSLRIRPYRTKDDKIDGVVLALIDIDELKRSLEQVMDIVWEPFLALDANLRVVKANGAFYQRFQTTPQETEGAYLYELGNGQLNLPPLRRLLEEVLPQKAAIKDLAVEHEFPKIGRRKMVLSARRLEAEVMGKELILLAMRDESDPVTRSEPG